MITKNDFIKATEEYNTFEKNVPAYYFRQAYASKGERSAKITIAYCPKWSYVFFKIFVSHFAPH